MIEGFLGILRYGFVLIFGVAVSLMFAGVKRTRSSRLAIAIFCTLIIFIQLLSWRILGLQTTTMLYPIITHLPLIAFLSLNLKRPWLISTSSVLAAYLCCQIPRWIGEVMAVASGSRIVDNITYIISMVAVFLFLRRYVATSVAQLIERSKRSCLLFGAIPLLYYLFDYTTTIYTDLLYSGSWVAVQFMPSIICTFYFVFVILYFNESQKQAEAQRERDIFSSQLNQTKLELDNMRQMQKNTMIFRHDMRHHLALIGGFLADGDIDKIKDYLAITEVDIDAMTPIRYCENETVNLILSSFQNRASKADVVLNTEVKLPHSININDTELCALLSNALENAIVAASKMEDNKLRKVYIHAFINNNKLIISTENAYVGSIEMDGELPLSRSKEPGHGFGIKSMVAIVERHGGLYSFETEGGVFILRIMLPLDK
ncbi:MAG: GHKL domain-containing protein [Anaerolineaceae bacterium]|nr:MAG: GHKL domain-containing protein [Anaerolineaceae bacterium]